MGLAKHALKGMFDSASRVATACASGHTTFGRAQSDKGTNAQT